MSARKSQFFTLSPGTKPEELVGPDRMTKAETNKFMYEVEVGTHKWYDGAQHPWEFKRIWHLEPSLTDPDTVYAGAEDAAIFKTRNGGRSWNEHSGLRNARGIHGSPVRAGLLCTRFCWIRKPDQGIGGRMTAR
jgi:hypothetical protein